MFSFAAGSDVSTFRTPKVTSVRQRELLQFQKKIGLKFKRIELLDLAFCHRSFVNETSEEIDNNERLEFLGDSVLGLVVADYLFRLLISRPEGDLARIKSHVVSEDSLVTVALQIGIDSIVRVGRGEELSGGRQKKALLSDSMEALIGAWYLDAGYSKASKFVLRCFKNLIESVIEDRHKKNYKTLLQEFAQKRYHSCPKYILDKKTGPDHQQTFWITVLVNEVSYGPGSGTSKKSAEQKVAQMAWEHLAGHGKDN